MKQLAERHRQMLEEESSIAPDIIRARGYRTITANEARKLGFTGIFPTGADFDEIADTIREGAR